MILCALGESRQVHDADAEMPLPPIISTPQPEEPSQPPRLLANIVSTLPLFRDALRDPARNTFEKLTERMRKDQAEAIRNGAEYQPVAKPGTASGELRIEPRDVNGTIQEVISYGYTLTVNKEGRLDLLYPTPLPDEDFGFNRGFVKTLMENIDWPDKELRHELIWGFSDYSHNTPPVACMSAHSLKAKAKASDFFKLIDDEAKLGWITAPQPFPPHFPFRALPGSIEPETDGKLRLVWNASIPRPNA